MKLRLIPDGMKSDGTAISGNRRNKETVGNIKVVGNIDVTGSDHAEKDQ